MGKIIIVDNERKVLLDGIVPQESATMRFVAELALLFSCSIEGKHINTCNMDEMYVAFLNACSDNPAVTHVDVQQYSGHSIATALMSDGEKIYAITTPGCINMSTNELSVETLISELLEALIKRDGDAPYWMARMLLLYAIQKVFRYDTLCVATYLRSNMRVYGHLQDLPDLAKMRMFYNFTVNYTSNNEAYSDQIKFPAGMTLVGTMHTLIGEVLEYL